MAVAHHENVIELKTVNNKVRSMSGVDHLLAEPAQSGQKAES